MKYKKLMGSGLNVSTISLGSWLTFGHKVDKAPSLEIIRTAYEKGINSFDTADAYSRGEAEKIMGEALSVFPRESYVLATKAFYPITDDANGRGLSRKHIFEAVNNSLKRLNTDYIDIFYCHDFDYDTPIEETLMAINDLIKQGKILYVGLSKWNADQISEAVAITEKYLLNKIVVNQAPYNLLKRNIEKDMIPVCNKNKISQIAFSPLAQGMLTGKYKSISHVPEDSRASDPDALNGMNKNNYFSEENFKKVEQLSKIADDLGITLPELSLAWLISQPHVASAIIGVSKMEQLLGNIKAADITLSEEVLNILNNI